MEKTGFFSWIWQLGMNDYWGSGKWIEVVKIAALGKGKDGYPEKKGAFFATDSAKKRKKKGSFLKV